MTAAHAAGAGDPLRLEQRKRCRERFDAGEMGAIGASSGDEIGTAIEQDSDIAPLHGGGDGFGAGDQRALVGRREPQQHGGDIAGGEGCVEVGQEGSRILE
jgi:hypothetical protein